MITMPGELRAQADVHRHILTPYVLMLAAILAACVARYALPSYGLLVVGGPDEDDPGPVARPEQVGEVCPALRVPGGEVRVEADHVAVP